MYNMEVSVAGAGAAAHRRLAPAGEPRIIGFWVLGFEPVLYFLIPYCRYVFSQTRLISFQYFFSVLSDKDCVQGVLNFPAHFSETNQPEIKMKPKTLNFGKFPLKSVGGERSTRTSYLTAPPLANMYSVEVSSTLPVLLHTAALHPLVNPGSRPRITVP